MEKTMNEAPPSQRQTGEKKKPTMSVGKETNIWRTYLDLHRGNPHTYDIYELNLNHFVKFIRECNPALNQIDDKGERANAAFKLVSNKLLDNFLLQMQKSGYAKNTIAIQIKVLKGFFNWVDTAESKGFAEHLKKYWNEWARGENKFKVDITADEINELLTIASNRSEGFSTRFAFAINLEVGSGARPAEALGMCWEDLHIPKLNMIVKEIADGLGADGQNYNGAYLRKRESIIYGPKGGRSRVVPLSDNTVRVVRQLLQELEGDTKPAGRVYPESYDVYAYRFKQLIKKSGIQYAHPSYTITPHKLRHYFFHNFVNVGRGPITIAQKIAGHSRIETTMIYLAANTGEMMREYAKAVGASH